MVVSELTKETTKATKSSMGKHLLDNLIFYGIKKKGGIFIGDNDVFTSIEDENGSFEDKSFGENGNIVATFAANLMTYGYVMSPKLMEYLSQLDNEQITAIHDSTIRVIRNLVGDDVEHDPMYPNFPSQVMEMSNAQLYMNAIFHYFTHGHWRPDYEKLPREFAFEEVEFVTLDILSKEDYEDIFTTILASNASISDEDKQIVEWFIGNQNKNNFPFELLFPKDIPFKENLCLVAGNLLKTGNQEYLKSCVKTATDLLRVIIHLCDGDISLAENTRFKSFPRAKRKLFIDILENVIKEEDVQRHRNKWVRLFHNLHVGDYENRAPKTFEIAQKVRNGERLESINSQVEEGLKYGKAEDVVHLLKQRPGEYARRLDHLIRKSEDGGHTVVDEFMDCGHKVSTRVLMQLKAHFRSRAGNSVEKRVIFPKGSVAKAQSIENELEPIDEEVVEKLNTYIDGVLRDRFAEKESLGKVYLDENLKECPIPTQQRSASASLYSVATGTRLPMTDKSTLRFFIYWVGMDIDLSATLHDENFEMVDQISYTNLKSTLTNSCHSGDITRAQNGASEFIDINVEDAVDSGIKYIVMNVFVFSGPTFAEHDTCYAGYMTRDYPDSNEIVDPKTVEQKMDVESNSRNAIPVVFDIEEGKAIWCDLSTIPRINRGGNNIHSNRATIQDMLEAMVNLDNKPTLYDLLRLHADARAEKVVEDKEEADISFAREDADVTAYHVNEVVGEYLE